MSDVFTVAPEEVSPERDAVLALLGIPAGTQLGDRIERLYTHALGVLGETIAPRGLIAEIEGGAFDAVYAGDGKNAPETPVALVAPRAEHRALFAVTLGEPLSRAVAECFTGADFALGYTLDAMASVAADAAAAVAERRFARTLRERGWATADGAVLRYSPGYCGWDITGQRRLFAALQPGAIGLTLNDSCLMQPLKSVSGVLLAGPRTIHKFPPTFDCCARCAERTCRDRLATLFAGAAH